MCCHTKPQEEGIKRKLTEAFTTHIWIVGKTKHRRNAKTAEEAVTADITEVNGNCQSRRWYH